MGIPTSLEKRSIRASIARYRFAVRVRGISDTVSGFVAFRLILLRHALTGRSTGKRPLLASGWAANAELIGRAARQARRIESIPIVERYDLRSRESRIRPWKALRETWHAATLLRRQRPETGAIS